ncbi:hypothetical protein M8494_11590 [Serratia ureilytica]
MVNLTTDTFGKLQGRTVAGAAKRQARGTGSRCAAGQYPGRRKRPAHNLFRYHEPGRWGVLRRIRIGVTRRVEPL